MNKLEAIYTEETNCQDCYKCIRHCPVKAIKIENHSASIIHSQCIFCGKCVSVCPSGAKKLRNDVQTAQFLLKQSKPVILSLAPTYPIDFDKYTKSQFIYALKQLGFARVSETALGAEILSERTSDWLSEQKSGVYISSCCPSIVHLIQKYYPKLSANITPLKSPAQIHASYLRELYGDVTIIFAGPCIAKKTELAYPDNNINLALSFQELEELLQDAGLQPEYIKPHETQSFEPFEAHNGKAYPVDGGMLNSMKPNVAGMDASFMSFSGIENVKSILNNLPEVNNGRLFLELMTCTGGCINGPGRTSEKSIATSRLQIIEDCNSINHSLEPLDFKGNIYQPYNFLKAVNGITYSEKLILKTLNDIGKNNELDELNCGGCGYYTCRLFAKAILDEKAESQMCVSYMRRMAQNKAYVLLEKIPYGFVIVDEDLKITESNRLFASICGPDVVLAFDAKPGLEGADISKVTSISRLFQNLLESGNDRIEKQIRFDNTVLHVSVFTIQKHKKVCAIVQNPDTGTINRDDLLESMQQIIRENMQTAQKVAGLLGENASKTECTLNKIIDSYSGERYEDKYVY